MKKVIFGIAGLVLLAAELYAQQQPVPYSHKTHLAMGLKCNSCHDSFISNWKLRDSYGLAAFFSTEPLEMVRCDVKTGEIVEPKFLYPELGEVRTDGTLEQRRAEAARIRRGPRHEKAQRLHAG